MKIISVTLVNAMKRHGWLTLLAITVLIIAFPVTFKTTRLILLISVVVLWLWGAFLLRKRKVAMAVILTPGILLLGWLCLPGRPSDPDVIQRYYVECLRQYTGTYYLWGGENRLGIDCSGLVRRGLINANVKMGIQTKNPRLVRNAFILWWHDCSARALRDEYRGFTSRLFTAASINSIERGTIKPGDLAVTENGIHVLAYLGGNTWIEADPDAMRVIMVEVPSNNPWFTMPVHLVRWSQLFAPLKRSAHDR